MKIWNQLSETDPKYTKGFKKGGGFSGTAINPTYGIKKLTEAFGACGVGWGDEIIESRFDEGNWINEKDREVIHTIILKLWYMTDDVRHEVVGVGTTAFVSSNKYGVFTDEEYFKKTMTDALSNASKKLGLSADIFMGLYDDSKYLNEVTQKFNKPKMPTRASVNKALGECKTDKEWTDIRGRFEGKYGTMVFLEKSGHKQETWGNLFAVHHDRIHKVNPIDANKHPDDTVKEWREQASKQCSKEVVLELEKQLNQNKVLQTDENYKILETLFLAVGDE